MMMYGVGECACSNGPSIFAAKVFLMKLHHGRQDLVRLFELDELEVHLGNFDQGVGNVNVIRSERELLCLQ